MAFGSIELASLLGAGAVTFRSVRLWARVTGPDDFVLVLSRAATEIDRVAVRIDDADADFTAAWTYPDDFEGAPDLAPDEPYRARLEHGGEVLGEAMFRTAPTSSAAAPRRWAFGAFSCHQPFSPHGDVSEGGAVMIEAGYQALAEFAARFVLMMGDQIYGDYPPSRSLFDDSYFATIAPRGRASILECTAAEVRAIYQQRHRQFWALPGFQRIQSSFACYPILDDHEVVDNFGTDPEHAKPAWEEVREGALDAFFDYQVSRVLRRAADGGRPPVFDYGFTWGPAATYVMDIRSPRRTRGGKTRVYTEAQLESLRSFLEANADRELFSLVTTIPLVYIEGRLVKIAASLLSRGSDIHERWGHPQCIEHRDRLVCLLHDHSLRHPHQQILLLGGDVHTGAAYEIQFDDGPRWHQLISSAISNTESLFLNKSAELASRAFSEIDIEGGPRADVKLLEGTNRHHKNPVGALNIGLVEVIDRDGGVGLVLKLVTEAHGKPRIIFSSDEIPPPT